MRMKFFRVRACDPGEAEAELNRFLAAHRIVEADRSLVSMGADSYWAIALTTAGGQGSGGLVPARSKVDYREALPPEEFKVYSKLRDVRRAIATREGVPIYAVMTNEQLAAIVRQRITSPSALGRIDGVGPARVEKFGAEILAVMTAATLDPPSAPIAPPDA